MKYDDVQHAVQSPQGTSVVASESPLLSVTESHVEKLPAGARPASSLSEDGDIG